MRREILENTAVLGTGSAPYANIWVGEAERTTNVFDIMLLIPPKCTTLNMCQGRPHMLER